MSDEKITLRVQLSYPLERVKEPVLYRLIKDYSLVPNILRANIEIHSGGFIELDISGNKANLDAGLEWMRSCGISVGLISDK